MAVILPPQTSGNIVPEYAATFINFNRQIQNIAGVLVAVFTAQIAYERKDYLVNEAGEKIGVVSMDPPRLPTPGGDDRCGNIYLSAEQVAALFVQSPATGKVLGEVIADMADALIREELIARKII